MKRGNFINEEQQETIKALLAETLPIAAYNGWNDRTFATAAEKAGVGLREARMACPNKCLDLARAFHEQGDDLMKGRLQSEDLTQMRFRDRVAFAIRLRLVVIAEHRDATRKAASFFSVPMNARYGAEAIWKTVDQIWNCLGDPSEDINWYTKRLTLAAVYSSTLLYWIGDESEGSEDTWRFIDRRIDEVMKIEEIKGRVRSNPLSNGLMRGMEEFGRRIRKPKHQSPYPSSTE